MAGTIAEISEETIKLQMYIESKQHGEELSFDRIAHDTGVVMDERNKQKLRVALKRAKREYSAIINYGIKLADSHSTMGLLTNKLVKIDRAVRRGERTQKNLQEQFFSSLNTQEQKEILYIGAVFGAIRVAAENGKVIYSKRNIKEIENIPIPK